VLVSVLNVYFRDVQHLLELALLAWFWMTPIVYPIAFVQSNLGTGALWRVYLLNPMTHVVLALQRGIYGRASFVDASGRQQQILVNAPASWYLRNLAIVGAGGLVLVVVAWVVFQRLESRLAEEL
jgi:ABC-2 type transport system permease protein